MDHADQSTPETSAAALRRRGSLAAMAAGLLAGYGALAALALRYLYPAKPVSKRWIYVTQLSRMKRDETLVFRTPTGETVNVTRKAEGGTASDFVALSSVCPHLGCQVHWEAQNERYFCPCHNGVFDPAGVGVSGPPGDAGQSLARYDLKVDGGLLYVHVAVEGLAASTPLVCEEIPSMPESRPGHDPCLAQLPRRRPA